MCGLDFSTGERVGGSGIRMGHGQGTGAGHKGGGVTDILKICTYCFVQKKKTLLQPFQAQKFYKVWLK